MEQLELTEIFEIPKKASNIQFFLRNIRLNFSNSVCDNEESYRKE